MFTKAQSQKAFEKLDEIREQLGQPDYPYDPEELLVALQAVSEGRLNDFGWKPPSMVHAPQHIPKELRVVEDVAPNPNLSSDKLKLIRVIERNETSMSWDTFRERARKCQAVNGLVDAVRIMEGLNKSYRRDAEHYIQVFPGTVLRNSDGKLMIPCLQWQRTRLLSRRQDMPAHWELSFHWVKNDLCSYHYLVSNQ